MKLNKIIQLTYFVVFMWTTTIMAQNNTYKWAKSVGTSTAEASQSITIDATGNIYTTGYFQGTVDFDPGPGVTNLVSSGGNDIFITKFDANGNLIWAKSIGGTSADISYGIALDATGNVFTTGYFGGSADFDPGIGIQNLTSAGSFDIFICKIDSNGDYVWAKSIGGASNDAALGIKLDSNTNIYLVGYFGSTTIDFDPSVGVANLTNNGSGDGFVSKFDTNGNYIWAKTIGGTSIDQATTLNIDASANIYIVGYFSGTVDFDPSVNTANMTSGVSMDFFICKFNTNGEYVWAKKFESATAKSGSAVGIDNNGNTYIAGTFAGTVDFDPSASTANLTSNGGNDNFICKLNANGEYVWVKSFGGTGAETVSGITFDSDNNIYSTGSFTGTVDFDPSTNTDAKVSNGNTDIFINKLDVDGNYVWTTCYGGTGADRGIALAVDGSNNVITTGTYSLTVDFNPGASVANLTSNGSTDVFFSKLGTCVPVFSTDVQTSCGAFLWYGTTYTSSNNTATYSFTNEGGCTNVITLNLTITGSPNNWTGATNNLWNEASNWSCGVVPDSSNNIEISSGSPVLNIELTIPAGKSLTISGTGALIIAPGKVLTIAGSADFGGKSVIFQSDATGSGLFGPLTGTLTGANNIQVERYIPARRAFRFLSPSVTTTTTIKQNWQENGGTTAGLGTHITGTGGATNGFDVTGTNNPSMFTFDNGSWVAVANTNVNVLNAGTPYRLMVRGDRTTDLTTNSPTATSTTLRATGILKTGNFVPTINQTADGFSLVGNPYQAPIDIKAILTASSNMSSGVVYYWDPTLNVRGGYVTRNLTTNVNDVTSSFNQYVQPGQAVFVKRDNTANVASVTITESHKSVANGAAGVFRMTTSNDYGLLRVNLQANTNNQWQNIEGTLALFNDNFSWNVTQEDATKMSNLDEEVSFVQNNTSLAIACLSAPSGNSELPIQLNNLRQSNYQWQFELNNYGGATPYLFDTQNNTYTEITNGTTVPFTATTTAGNRFKIVFQPSALNTDDFENSLVVYPNPAKAGSSFYIQGITVAEVTVYNVLGQNIPVDVKLQGDALQVTPTQTLSQGIYLVTVTTEGKTQQLKWIVE